MRAEFLLNGSLASGTYDTRQRNGVGSGVLVILAAYSVTAVFAFLQVYAPAAGAGRIAESLIQWSTAFRATAADGLFC